MTLEVSAGPVQYSIEAPPGGPMGPGVEDLKYWTYEMLQRLVQLQQQPRVQDVMWTRAEAATDPPVLRPAPGMMVWAAANVIGAGKPEGLYFYVGGVWKLVTLS
jgi:hypothetical protein